MATTLQRQLAALATPSSSLLVPERKINSILFTPQEAAKHKRDVFYEIGLDGLDELIKIDPIVFKKFQFCQLFDEASKNYERIVADSEENAKLDTILEEFLISLSPYLMLKSSLKCLEWLINRFHIEKFNVDLIMESFIPYYDTKSFSLVVEILDVNKRSVMWQWIIPNVQTGLPINKSDLYAQDSARFLIWIFSTFRKFVKFHERKPENLRTFISFMTTTISGILTRISTSLQTDSKKATKVFSTAPAVIHSLWSQLAKLSTTIKENAQLNSNEEIQSMIYIICTVLFNVVKGRPELSRNAQTNVRKLMTYILKSHPRSLKTQAYLLLNLLSSEFENQLILTKKAQLKRTLNEISILSSDWDLWHLSSQLLLNQCVEEMFKLTPSKLWQIVQSIEYTIPQRSNLLRSLYSLLRTREHSRKWTKGFLTRFEREYPTEFDMACENDPEFASGLAKATRQKNFILLSQHTDVAIRKEAVQKLLKRFKLQHLKNHDDSVIISPPKKSKRNQQLKKPSVTLKKKTQTLKKTKKLKTVIPDANRTAETLLPRFSDDSQEIVHVLIKQNIVLLTKIFTTKTLVEQLVCIVQRKDCDRICLRTALLKLCKIAEQIGSSDSDKLLLSKIFVELIPYLFPTKAFTLKLSISILKTSFAKENPFLCKYSDLIQNSDVSAKKICDYSYDAVTSSLKTDFLCQNWTVGFRNEITAVYALLTWNSTEGFNRLLDEVDKLDCRTLSQFPITKDNFPSCIRLASKKKSLALDLVLTTILKLNLKNFEHIEHVVKFVFRNCEKLENRNPCIHFLEIFLKKLFPTESQQLSFWVSMIINVNKQASTSDLPADVVDEFILIRILQCLCFFVKDCANSIKNVLGSPGKYLTAACGSDNDPGIVEVILTQCINRDSHHLRLWGLNCLEAYREIENSYDSEFVQYILNYRREILADREQVVVIIGKAFEDERFLTTRNRFIKIIVERCVEESVGIGLLKMFKFTSGDVFSQLFSLAKDLLKTDPASNKLLAILNCFDGSLDKLSFEILIEALKHKQACSVVLSKITPDVFQSYNMTMKKKLIALFIDVVVFSKIPEIKILIQRRIRKWILDASIISAEIEKCITMEKLLSSITNGTASTSKKTVQKRISESVSAFGDVAWTNRTEVVLEFVQTKKRLKEKTQLIQPLFKLLKICIAMEEQSPVEYLKQLILTTLTLCCHEDDTTDNQKSDDWIHFNADTVIDCLRCSRNPQTHHHALILLNYAAKKYPEQVLHGVMSLFTFMGNSILRQDDAYSTQLIQQTVTTIIPTLANTTSVRQFSKSLVSAGIFRVFTCAVQHIPVHRRLPVFISLVETLQPIEAMWQVCIIIVDNALTRDKRRSNLNADLELAMDLVWNFDADIVLASMEKVYSYLMDLPIFEKNLSTDKFKANSTRQEPHAKAIMDLSRKETLRDAQIVVLFTVELVTKICGKFGELENREKLTYDSLLQKCLSLSRLLASNQDDKIVRLIGQRNFEVIEKINAALEPKDFVRVTIAILNRDDIGVKRKMIDLLNQRILHQLDWFKDLKILLDLIPHLIELGKCIPETEEQVTLVQTAFLSLKLIAKYLGTTCPEEFIPVFQLANEQTRHKNRLLRASALLCMGELFSLKSLILPNLADICSSIIKAFKSSMKLNSKAMKSFESDNQEEMEHDDKSAHEGETSITTANLLCISTMSCLNKLVEQLGPFLGSAFLQKVLLTIFSMHEIFGQGVKAENRKKVFDQRVKTLLKTIGTKIPLRNSLVTIKEVFSKLEDLDSGSNKSLLLLLGLFKETLLITSKPDFTTLLPSLCDTFLEQFLLHREKMLSSIDDSSFNISLEQIEEVEANILECLVSGMVLKMSEGMFRPFYHKMFDWATDSLPRLITFYKLSRMAAERLKSLFVTFAGFVIHEASKQLTQDSTLTRAILSYFHQIFLHDREGFITIDRFNALVKPLVDLIESDYTLAGEVTIKQLNDTLVQLAVASNDLNRWQHMIDLLSLKTQNPDPKVRLFVISTIEAAAAELGKDFLPLLPPAVPFLAEMLNDDDEKVEKETRKMLLKLEDLLGEPLQPYFTI